MLFSLMEGLLPLEHLDLALESVTVLGDHAEVSIAEIYLVVNLAAHVHQLEFMFLVDRLYGVDFNAGVACVVKQSRKADCPALIFPEYHLRERYQN